MILSSIHLAHVEQILCLLFTNHFYAKLGKCTFGVQSVEYMGHIITYQGLQADPNKSQAIRDWTAPTSLATLRALLGLTGFCRRFVQHYATIVSPLTDLLKGNSFSWPPSVEQAFLKLKEAMLQLPILAMPKFSE